MAQPIPYEPSVRDPRRELIARLEQAPAQHAEALLSAYELLQQLHDRQVLETLRGALGANDKLLESVTSAAKSPDSVRALRNLIILGHMLASINPDLLHCIATAVGQTLGSERKPVIDPPGLLSLLAEFRQPELRRSVALINQFLDVLGNQLKAHGATQVNS
ncbi:MAG TPA: hypothetical protein VMV57_00640 [Terracidiphilus sp.]|nr:hypothetical protein [Terracidiphilus sp.]